MGYYLAIDGKAPAGMVDKDYVITNGGTYQISGGTQGNYTKYSNTPDTSITGYNYKQMGITPMAAPTAYNPYATPPTPGITQGQANGQALSPAMPTAPVTPPPTTPAAPAGGTWAGQDAQVSNYGDGTLQYNQTTGRITRTMPDGRQYYVDKGDAKYNSILNEYTTLNPNQVPPQAPPIPNAPMEYTAPDNSDQIAQLTNIINTMLTQQYNPVDVEGKLANTMTYEQAYEMANGIITPQYQQTYEDTATRSAQNLDRSGLYNSLYGQALSAQAQHNVDRDKLSAMGTLAKELQAMDYDQAVKMVSLLSSENQFGANYQQNALSTAAQTTVNIIDTLATQARDANNFMLDAALLQIKQEAHALDQQYKLGQIGQQPYETQMMQLEIQAQQKALESTGSSTNNYTYDPGDGGDLTYSEFEAKYNAGTLTQSEFNYAAGKGWTNKTWAEYSGQNITVTGSSNPAYADGSGGDIRDMGYSPMPTASNTATVRGLAENMQARVDNNESEETIMAWAMIVMNSDPNITEAMVQQAWDMVAGG